MISGGLYGADWMYFTEQQQGNEATTFLAFTCTGLPTPPVWTGRICDLLRITTDNGAFLCIIPVYVTLVGRAGINYVSSSVQLRHDAAAPWVTMSR